jgi:hypothetical protein
MPQSDKVQSSEEGKIRLRQVLQERKLTEKITQDEVAKQANVSLDTLKRGCIPILQKYQDVLIKN